MEWGKAIEFLHNANDVQKRDALCILSTTDENFQRFKHYLNDGNSQECINMIENGLISPNVLYLQSHLLFQNLKIGFFTYLCLHPATNVNVFDRDGDKVLSTYLRHDMECEKIEFLLKMQRYEVDCEVEVMLAVKHERPRALELILRLRHVSDYLMYRAFDECIQNLKLMESFLKLERFMVPYKYRKMDWYFDWLLRRKHIVAANRLVRWIGVLPRTLWELISKYYIYGLIEDKPKWIDRFKRVLLGKEDCDVDEILSVGGIWTEQNQRYLDDRRKEREFYQLQRQMDQLLDQNPQLRKKLKR